MNDLLNQVQNFFPKSNYSTDNFNKNVELDKLDISKQSHANTLKGALYDETILEVQIHDHINTVYFCRVLDNPFEDFFAESDGSNSHINPDYEKGSYLDDHERVFLTPFEPSDGNYLISQVKDTHCKIILKIITSGIAIELGCIFQGRTIVGNMPALKVSFPIVAQKSKNAREFRAKVPKSMKIVVTVERDKKRPITTSALNISLNGVSLIDPMGRKSNIQIKEKVYCSIQSPGEDPILLEAIVMHSTNLRNVSGIQYCFGLQFHFGSVTTKAAIEKLVGLVQRKHLRELSDIEQMYGVYFEK